MLRISVCEIHPGSFHGVPALTGMLVLAVVIGAAPARSVAQPRVWVGVHDPTGPGNLPPSVLVDARAAVEAELGVGRNIVIGRPPFAPPLPPVPYSGLRGYLVDVQITVMGQSMSSTRVAVQLSVSNARTGTRLTIASASADVPSASAYTVGLRTVIRTACARIVRLLRP